MSLATRSFVPILLLAIGSVTGGCAIWYGDHPEAGTLISSDTQHPRVVKLSSWDYVRWAQMDTVIVPPILTAEHINVRNAYDRKGLQITASPSVFADPATIASFYEDRTIEQLDAKDGPQIIYHHSNGVAYIWSPSQSKVRSASWQIAQTALKFRPSSSANYVKLLQIGAVCYRQSHNPYLTAERIFTQCKSYRHLKPLMIDHRSGDVFGLANHDAVPFVLDANRMGIAELLKRVKAGT